MRNLNFKKYLRLFFAVLATLFLGHSAFAQANSIASGDWNAPATWDCNCTPTTGAVVIRANHIVTVPVAYAPTATSVTVQNLGTLRNLNTSTAAFAGIPTFTFQSGSVYDHAANSGTIPVATWQSGSTCRITGTITVLPTNLNQSFHHFTYNSTVQTSVNVQFAGNLTTVNGNLTVENTGTSTSTNNRQITLGPNSAGTNGTLHVGGSFIVNNYSRVQLGASGLTYTVTIDDDFHISALQQIPGAAQPINNVIMNVGNANTTVTVADDFIIDGDAKFNMITGSGAQTNLNVLGDFVFSTGTFTRESTVGTANVNFNGTYNSIAGTGLQNYTGGGTFSGIASINYRIASTAAVDLQTYGLGLNGTFTNDGIVRLASLNSNGAVVGNIIPNNRTFSPGSTIIYDGAAEQSIGSTHPQGTSVTTTIENSSNVRLVDNATIGGTLNLTSGDILIDNRRLTLLGTVNAGTHHLNITSSSSIEIGGSGAFGTLPITGGTDINGFTINRTSGSVSIEQDLTIQGTLTQTAGDIVLEGFSLVLNGPFTRTAGTIVSNDPASTFIVQGAGSVPATAAFSGTFDTFDYNRDLTSMGTNTVFTVDNLILRRGILNNSSDLVISPGGIIQRFVGEMASPVDGTGSLFVTYSNQQDIFSGPELTPVTANRIEDVVIDGSANVFLASNVDISNDLTISSGGLFGQASTITLNGDLTVDGLADLSEATLVFNGNTTVSGAAIPQFGTMQVTSGSTLSLPTGANIFVAGDIDFPATASVNAINISLNLNGGAPQTISPNGLTINNLVVNKFNDTGVTLAAGLSVVGQVSVASPNTDVASGGFLRLVSTSDAGNSGDAWIGQLLDGASVSGVVHVERFMSSEGNIYRYLSAPVEGMSVDDLNNFMPVTGPFPGSTVCVSCFGLPSMHSYNNATLAYTPFPAANIAEEMQVGVGYATFVFQNALPGAVTIDFAGEINSGDLPLTVGYNNTVPTDSWNLVGNPYPATIDWDDDTGGWIKGSSIAPGIAVRDNGSGIFRYWDGVDGTLVDGLIAKGQAFWVRTQDNSDLTLSINEFAKASPIPAGFLRTGVSNHLVLKLANSAGLTDQAYLKERTSAKLEQDFFDVPKLNNQFFDLSTYAIKGTKTSLAINAIEHVDCIERVGVVTKDMTPGNYTLSMQAFGSFTEKNWKLFDKFTNTTFDLNEGSYSLSVTSNAASAAVDRFELVLDYERPDASLDVIAATPTVCNDAAVISIPQAQAAYSYEVIINGVPSGKQTPGAQDLLIKVDNSLLQAGANNIGISVVGGCPLNLEKTVSVSKSAPITAVATSRTECSPGSYKLEATGGEKYNWYDSETGGSSLGQDASFTTPSISATTTYYVAAVNACEGPRVATTISIAMPDAVAISVSEGTDELTSNYASGNQWSFNGTIIEGASGQTLVADKTGKYTVTVSTGECSGTASTDYIVTGLEKESGISMAWPNPVAGKLTIDIPSDLKVHSLWMQTTSGAISDRHLNPGAQVTIDMTQYSPGMYFLMMDTDTGRRVEKIVRN